MCISYALIDNYEYIIVFGNKITILDTLTNQRKILMTNVPYIIHKYYTSFGNKMTILKNYFNYEHIITLTSQGKNLVSYFYNKYYT